jgi:hypothetical protein
MITVKQILEKWLKENGYDGLATANCGCGLDDLIPCDGDGIWNCNAAYKEPCKKDPMVNCFVLERGKYKNCDSCDV